MVNEHRLQTWSFGKTAWGDEEARLDLDAFGGAIYTVVLLGKLKREAWNSSGHLQARRSSCTCGPFE